MSDEQNPRQTEARFPYPGLRAFQPHEAHLFFGRDEHVSDMFTLLENHKFLAVTGASGSGKSSLVRAGLLPRLRDEGLINQREGNWHFLILRPGKSPMDNLAAAFHAVDPLSGTALSQSPLHDDDPELTRVVLESGPRGVSTVLQNARMPEEDNVLILVDQFEEIFRFTDVVDHLSHTESQANQRLNEAAQFVSLLLNTARQSQRKVHVVLTMRTDFMGDCDRFEDLPQAINNAQYLTPRLSFHQLKSAVTGPLKLADYQAEIEPQLLDHILNAATTGRDRLPLIQHALLRIWTLARQDARHEVDENSDENGVQIVLTLNHARRCTDEVPAKGPTDWVSDVLAWHADEIYHGLESEQQRIASHLFCALCDDQGNARVVRRPTSLTEVAAIAQTDEASVDAVVSAFTGLNEASDADLSQSDRHFLIRYADRDESTRTVIDISHESVIRNWPRLTHWLKRESAWRRNLDRLIDATEQNQSGHGDFLAGRALETLSDWFDSESPTVHWADRYAPGKYQSALEFLLASKEKAAEEHRWRTEELEKQEAAERKREAEEKKREADRRIRRVLKYLVVALLVIVVGGIAALFSIHKQNEENLRLLGDLNAAKETIRAVEMKIAEANGKVEAARIEGEYVAKFAEANGRVRKGEYQEAIKLLEELVTLDLDQARKDTISSALKRLTKGQRSTETPITTGAVSQGGSHIVVAEQSGVVSVWPIAAGTDGFSQAPSKSFRRLTGPIDAVAVTPGGQSVFVAQGRKVYASDSNPTNRGAPSPLALELRTNVTTLELGSASRVEPALQAKLKESGFLKPRLIVGEVGGTVTILELDMDVCGQFEIGSAIRDIVYFVGHDGPNLVVVTSNSCLLVKIIHNRDFHLNPRLPDGIKDDRVKPLPLTFKRLGQLNFAPSVSLSRAALSPTSVSPTSWWLAVSQEKTGNIFLLELTEKNGFGSFTLKSTTVMHAKRVTDLAFSPDGTRLVTASDDYTLRVWNVKNCLEKDPEPVFKLEGHSNGVTACGFANEYSSLVVSASRDGSLRYWNLPSYEFERVQLRQGISDPPVKWMEMRWVDLYHREKVMIPIADGERLLTSMDVLERYIVENARILQNAVSGYHMWMVMNRSGNVIEVPIIKFKILQGRIGPGTEFIPGAGDVIEELQLVPIGPDGKRLPHSAGN